MDHHDLASVYKIPDPKTEVVLDEGWVGFHALDYRMPRLDTNIQWNRIWPDVYDATAEPRPSIAQNISDSINVETQETVTFNNDADVQKKETIMMRDIPGVLLKDVREKRIHDVRSFLQRPVRLRSGVWATTDAQNATLYTLDLPKDYFAHEMIKNKVEGFLGFRGKMVVRVVLNCQRFCQGRLMLVYMPQGQLNTTRWEVARNSIVLTSQMPRVELDAQSTEAQLKVPYVSTTTHYNIADNSGPGGRFALVVYSPMVTANCHYSVFVWMEDVEIDFPTYAYVQMAGLPAPSEQELPPISKALSVVSSVSTALGGAIPLISSVTRPLAWATNIGSKVAAAFGWSKPLDSSKITTMVQQPFRHAGNVTGIDTSHVLAFNADNRIRDMAFGGTDVDEMSFDYLKRIPSYYWEMEWTTANLTGDNLGRHDVRMNQFQKSGNSATTGAPILVRNCCVFSYFARYFRYWQGSIVLTFKVVKTEFHTGRLCFWFQPGISSAAPDEAARDYMYCEIIDLKEKSNEFSVTIPWVSTTEWKRTTYGAKGSSTEGESMTGQWGLNVLDPLVCPPTVSSAIKILIEAAGGPDFKLSVPIWDPNELPLIELPSTFVPETYPLYPAGLEMGRLERPAVCQGFGDLVTQKDSSPTIEGSPPTVGGDASFTGSLASSEYCIGEVFTSVRSLLKRFTWLWSVSQNNPQFQLRFPYPNPSYHVSGQDVVLSGTMYDPLTIFGPLFAFKRGAMRYKCARFDGSVNTPVKEFWRAYLGEASSEANGISIPTITTWDNALTANIFPNLTGGAEVEVPHYGLVHSYVNFFQKEITKYVDARVTDPNTAVFYCQSNTSYASGRVNFGRCCGEDFSLACFIGTMPVAGSNVLITTGTI